MTALAQKKISGVVTSSSGDPLPGVVVIEKGTSNIVQTDVLGKFVISITDGNKTFLFSCLGYKDKEVAYTPGKDSMEVSLDEDLTQLDDVVVIGYGTTTKKEVTGSVASLKSEDFVSGNNSSPYDLINGKIAGLSIIKGDGGDPNGGISVQLRGTTTMSAGATPLVVIDNVIGGTIDSINPEEIESIDVLKDGSAAAIYGTRGTNGVILITTKKGKKGENARVDFSTYVSTQSVSRKTEMLSADEFRQVLESGRTGFDGGASTDWLDAISRKTPITQYYNLAISGGAQNIAYRASASYTDDKGIIMKSDREDLRGSINLDQTLFDNRLSISYKLNYSSRVAHPTDQYAVQQAVRRNPTEPIYDAADKAHGGYYTNTAPFQYYNPVAMLNESDVENRYRTFLGSIRASYKLLDCLTLSATGSFNQYSGSSSSYKSKYYPQDV